MPVFVVAITAPNGNRVSRPIVAACACDAIAVMHTEHDVPEHDPAFTTEVTQRPDPDGQYERALHDAETRRVQAEFWGD